MPMKFTTMKNEMERYTGMRISHEAAVLMAVAVDRYIKRISETAKTMTSHAKRTTIKKTDLQLALKVEGEEFNADSNNAME